MATRTHLIEKKNPQHNQEWSWEETPAVKKALDEYWAQVKANEVV